MIRGVIFDLDGVIVRTDELHYQSWRALTAAENIPFDRALNERLRGVSRVESLEIVLARAPREYSAEQKATLAERKQARYLQFASRLTAADVLPGVTELIAALKRRGIRLAIGSSSRNAKLILRQLGLSNRFDVAVDGNDLARAKPDPEVYLRVAARLGMSPGECLVIEDAAAGVESARRAGMAVFGVGPAASLLGVAAGAADLAHMTVERLIEVNSPSGNAVGPGSYCSRPVSIPSTPSVVA